MYADMIWGWNKRLVSEQILLYVSYREAQTLFLHTGIKFRSFFL